ncbi:MULTISPECIES: DMT family transporter [unclassified Francisella]|uniref:DMT family transporter n=1 Tax=unclassified Francisella TaxID=2610885 RepID=UPI002E375035|nr:MULTISPECIES: DMT family transporter [unclassified Francisella]MED7819234.1 DMT family transporter [Francisella sp. 19S2-4]MED7830023.1 DMT family transporter [Francisella sp. 19S2-10]
MEIQQNHTRINILIAVIFVLLAQLVTGINITGSKYIIETTPILVLVESRFIIGALFLIVVFLFLNKKKKKAEIIAIKSLNKKQWLVLVGQALGGGALFNLIMLAGVQFTSASMAGVITSTLPAMILVLMFFILGVRLTPLKIICVGLAILGLIIININGMIQPKITTLNLLGDFIIFVAMVPEAMYYVLVKVMPLNIKPLSNALLVNIINAIFVAPFMFFTHYDTLQNLTSLQYWIILLLGIVSGLFYLFWTKGSEFLEASTTGMMTALMPIFTLVISWLFLNETINLTQTLAMLLIIVSIIIGNWRRKRR